MATLRANRLRLLISSTQAAASPAEGGGVVQLDIDERPATGTTNGQWDLHCGVTYTISASSTENVDLTSLADPFGGAVAFAEIDAIAIVHMESSASSSVDLSPNASNGWTSIFQDASDLTRLLAGQAAIYADFAAGGGFAVGASNKVLDIVNNDGANAATVRLYAWGRSA